MRFLEMLVNFVSYPRKPQTKKMRVFIAILFLILLLLFLLSEDAFSTVPDYTIYTGEAPSFKAHPRLLFRHTDKAMLTARTDDPASWDGMWDSYIIPAANSYKAASDSSNCQNATPDGHLLVLAFAGWIEEVGRPTNGYTDKAIKAALYLSGLADDAVPDDKRQRCIALSLVFDICYDQMSTTEKNTVAAEILQQVDRQSCVDTEQMDGHSENDQTAALAGELAIYGWGTYTSPAQTRLTKTLGFLYGTQPNQGRIEMPRYEHTDGGNEKGGWYTWLGMWGEIWPMWFLRNATNLNPWSDEAAWASKCWEWFMWSELRGGANNDFESQGDTAKQSDPKFHVYQSWVMGPLISNYPNTDGKEGGRMLRWMYDKWATFDPPYAPNRVWDVIFIDRAAVAPRHPKDTNPVLSTSRLFSPPGVYYYRQSKLGSGYADWDYDNSVVVRVSARKWYYLGHPHLDSGAVQIHLKGDVILQAPAGYYDTYGGTHHYNAYQRTWLQSLAPLIYDPSAVYTRYSDPVANDGGQQFRKYKLAQPPSVDSDPNYVYAMQNDAGGRAWLRCEEFTKVDNPEYVFLYANIRESYKRNWDDPQRCPVGEIKYLIIKPSTANGLSWPAILYYARIKKANSTWVTQIPFHSYNAWTLTPYGFHSYGYYRVAKLWVDIRDIGSYTTRNNPPGTPLDAYGYGPNQFKIGGVGPNWPPSKSAGTRYQPDLKRNSVFLEKTIRSEEENYVALLMTSEYADQEPANGRSWVTDASHPDFYGVTLGTKTYLIHRTQRTVVVEGGSADTVPPKSVTNITVSG